MSYYYNDLIKSYIYFLTVFAKIKNFSAVYKMFSPVQYAIIVQYCIVDMHIDIILF